jgi:hypothetical protein
MHNAEANAKIVAFGNKVDLVGQVPNDVTEWCAAHQMRAEGWFSGDRCVTGRIPASTARRSVAVGAEIALLLKLFVSFCEASN